MELEPNNIEFLLQTDIIGKLLPAIGKAQWQTLYLSDDHHRIDSGCGARFSIPMQRSGR